MVESLITNKTNRNQVKFNIEMFKIEKGFIKL
jgi:hypothetical protein